MKNVLVIVTLSTLLSACAEMKQQTPAPAAMPGKAILAAAEEMPGPFTVRRSDGTTPPPAGESLPSITLSDELLFKLMKAEIAYQRGQWQTAYVTLLTLAHQTRDPRIARRATEVALSAKQSEEALVAIRLWRELAPTSEEATQYYLGFILLGEDIEEARSVFAQRLKDVRPQVRGVLMFQIQRLLTRVKNKAAAFAMLDDLLTPYKSSAEAHISLAQSAFAADDSVRARAEAREALAIKPDSELAALTLVQVTTDKNDALKFLTSFLSAYPKANEVRIAYARVLIDQKQYAKARHEFEILLKAQPKDLTTLYALGILGTQTNDLKSAEKYLTMYLDILTANPDEDRDPTQALLILAQIAEDRKDTEGALKWLAQIEAGEAYFGAQIKRAQIVAKHGDLARARKMLSEIPAEGEREQIQVAVAEAQLLRDGGKGEEALALLAKTLEQHPANTDLLYDYAMVAEKLDRLELMETSLRKVIELAPNNQHAYNALGYSLAERNLRLPEALTLIEKALSLAPEDPFILDSMGWVNFRLGKLKEAEELLRRAYELRPDPEIAVHLGEVLWVRGQKDDAQKFWRDANTKDPQNDTLKNTLSRLHVRL